MGLAQRLAAAGHRLILVDVDRQLDRAARELGAGSAGSAGSVEALRGDITDEIDVGALAERVEAVGPLRALVHAAGVSPTMGDWRRVFEVDLVGTALVVDALRPLVTEGSAAVCFASIAAVRYGITRARTAVVAMPTREVRSVVTRGGAASTHGQAGLPPHGVPGIGRLGAMRVVVDFDLCESNALCMAAAPEVFEVRDDDYLYVLQEEPPEELRQKVETAVRTCPKAAISIVD